jgi:Ser/Thr protein kinase RdoA (MazF antagonist)
VTPYCRGPPNAAGTATGETHASERGGRCTSCDDVHVPRAPTARIISDARIALRYRILVDGAALHVMFILVRAMTMPLMFNTRADSPFRMATERPTRMSTSGRLRSAALRYKRRLRSLLRRDDTAHTTDAYTRTLLRNWGIEGSCRMEYLGGSTGGRWLVETRRERYVLREVVVAKPYLEYELMVMEYLGASQFPYEVPVVVRTTTSSQYLSDGRRHWVLYRFVEGTRGSPPSARERARSLGVLVAHYDRAIEPLDLGTSRGRFRLTLFDVGHTTAALARARERIGDGRGRRILRRLVVEEATPMSDALHAAAESSTAVQRLPTITAYDDWHRHNVLERSGAITGLIDFDSIVEAPRIVDVQNALTYVLASTATPQWRLLAAFLDGYESVAPLTDDEPPLVYPVMLDRVAWLTADILDEICRTGRSTRESVAVALIRLFAWMRSHEREWIALMQARRPTR